MHLLPLCRKAIKTSHLDLVIEVFYPVSIADITDSFLNLNRFTVIGNTVCEFFWKNWPGIAGVYSDFCRIPVWTLQ